MDVPDFRYLTKKLACLRRRPAPLAGPVVVLHVLLELDGLLYLG